MRRLAKTVSFYPITLVFVAGVVFMVLVAEGVMDLLVALLCYATTTLMVTLLSIRREVRIVHKLVNSQRDELLQRIQDLLDALTHAGIAVPKKRDDQSTGG